MEEIFVSYVEGSIGYRFRNHDLLRQAFTRRSYTQEHGGENNEVLEFIGDKALDFAVVQLLIREYGEMKDGSPAVPVKSTGSEFPRSNAIGIEGVDGANSFTCSIGEGKLSEIKSRMVGSRYLASRIDELGFAKFIIMGEGDQKNKISDEASVKEDLFEAIIGAVTLDCGWNFSVISSAVEAMLCLEDFLKNDAEDNYVRLIQEWEESTNHTLPLFWFHEGLSLIMYHLTAVPTERGVIYQTLPSNDISLNYTCDLKLLDRLPVFRGWGVSKSKARMNVCKLAYDYLLREKEIEEWSIRDEIGEPTKEFAINQLEILARRGYFPLPKYTFMQDYDKDGNPVWQCHCSIGDFETQASRKTSSKKDAKKAAALKMLQSVLNSYE